MRSFEREFLRSVAEVHVIHQIDFFYKGYDYASSKIYRVLHVVRST